MTECLELEHQIAPILARQMAHGVLFDVDKAQQLEAVLLAEKARIRLELQTIFQPRVINKGEVTPKVNSNKYHTKKGATYSKIEFQEYNPSSRQQTVDRLIKELGWTPQEFTDKGNPQLDEEILESLPFDKIKPLQLYYIIDKRLGQLSKGVKAWLKVVKPNNRIYGSILQSGTITGRMSHFCVPMDTRALTRSGWKNYEDLIIGEEILAYDLNTHTKKWTPLLAKNKFNDARVGRLYCGRRSFRCTANHKWIIKNKDYYLRNKELLTRRKKGTIRFLEADKIGGTHAVLINAPYSNSQQDSGFRLVNQKYGYNYYEHITRMSDSELNAFVNGFLLADGCYKKSANGIKDSWSFAQAEGDLFDFLLTASYLLSDKRIGVNIKNIPLKNQRLGYNVALTQTSTLRNRKSMRWVAETNEDVWCPVTKFGTWVMRQGNEITITGNSPNTAQVPSNDKPWGRECRELFCVPKGKIMIGVDADALELRCLAGYIKPFDKGRFITTVLEGKKEEGTDMHTINSIAYDIDGYTWGRDCSKVLFYAGLYGAKNPKLGLILQSFGLDFHSYVENFDEQMEHLIDWSKRKKTGFSEKFLECLLVGKTARENFGQQLPELPALIKDVQERWKTNGYLKGLDGRKLFPRSEHSAFNTLLQSAGAIIMKKALYIADTRLQEKLVPGKDYEFILNIHDEWQLECIDNPEVISYTRIILEESIKEAGEYFKFNCPMKGNSTQGYSWADTH